MKLGSVLTVIFFLLKINSGSAQGRGDLLIGNWIDTKRQTIVRCYRENGKYFAKAIWIENLKEPGKPLPKEKQHWIHMVVMKNFEYKNNEWVNGTIYQPRTDKTYSAYITLEDDNTLKITGYVWLRVFSESETFTRLKK